MAMTTENGSTVYERRVAVTERLAALRAETDIIVDQARALHETLRLLQEQRRALAALRQQGPDAELAPELLADVRRQEHLLIKEAGDVGRCLADLLRYCARLQAERLAVLAAYEELLREVYGRSAITAPAPPPPSILGPPPG
jgi:hypothetical protein